jgi:hypothetical protein
MIFPNLELEDVLQVDDRTRLDGTKTYITQGQAAITKVEIEPNSGAGFIDVTADRYLDFQYDHSGNKNVSIRVTAGSVVTATKSIMVVTSGSDHLFSTDEDIRTYEDDILRYVRSGRNSFLDKHRAAQRDILDELDRRRIYNSDGTRFEKTQLVDIVEVKTWSKFKTLSIIFQGLSNAVDDVFSRKSNYYADLALQASKQAIIRLDLNKDEQITSDEFVDTWTTELVRR